MLVLLWQTHIRCMLYSQPHACGRALALKSTVILGLQSVYCVPHYEITVKVLELNESSEISTSSNAANKQYICPPPPSKRADDANTDIDS